MEIVAHKVPKPSLAFEWSVHQIDQGTSQTVFHGWMSLNKGDQIFSAVGLVRVTEYLLSLYAVTLGDQ